MAAAFFGALAGVDEEAVRFALRRAFFFTCALRRFIFWELRRSNLPMGGASNTMGGSGVKPDDLDSPFDSAILDAILANPADDAPRLVYADHLIERGETRRGELIVVQIERERLEREKRRATAEYRRLRQREAELTPKRVGFRTYADRQTRGFTSHLWIGPIVLRGRWDQFRREPLEWITFQHDYGPVPLLRDLQWLMTQPSHLQMVGLQTHTGSVSMEATALRKALLDQDGERVSWPEDLPPDPSLEPAVRRLHFHDWKPAFGAFIDRVRTNLVELSVSGAPDPSLLARIPSLQKLSAWLDPDVAFALLDTMELPALHNLALQGRAKKPLGAEGAARIAKSRVLEALTSLVADVPLDETLATALGSSKLEVFSPGLGVTESGLRAFGTSELPKRLRWLSLTNRGQVQYARSIAEAPFAQLQSLKLEGFTIDEASAELFANHAGLAGLVDFKLTLCAMKPAAAQLLARSPHLENIIEPKFTQCRLFNGADDILRERWPDAIFLGK